MAYKLLPLESIEHGVRRVATEQLDQAVGRLVDAGDLDERVHDVRKHLKKLRGLLRLVRFELGEECFDRENACFRDGAHELSSARSSAALIACLDDLTERFGEQRRAFDAPKRRLLELRRASVDEALDAQVLPKVVQTLRLARERVELWPISDNGWKTVGDGLRLTYARGKKAFERVYAAEPASDVLFHEWRKLAKYHWYHVRLLQDVWHKPMKMRRRALKRLSDLLGDDHDLAELRSVLLGLPGTLEREPELLELPSLIAARHAELRSQARHLGRRLYAERSKHLEHRFASYFSAWRAHAGDPTLGHL